MSPGSTRFEGVVSLFYRRVEVGRRRDSVGEHLLVRIVFRDRDQSSTRVVPFEGRPIPYPYWYLDLVTSIPPVGLVYLILNPTPPPPERYVFTSESNFFFPYLRPLILIFQGITRCLLLRHPVKFPSLSVQSWTPFSAVVPRPQFKFRRAMVIPFLRRTSGFFFHEGEGNIS